jgi:hypothetical protein
MSKDVVARQEQISSSILSRSFADLGALTGYLDRSKMKFLLVADAIGKQPPESPAVTWDPENSLYYLVLLPRTPQKLFRFRVYETAEGLHLESDFAYKNPYQ